MNPQNSLLALSVLLIACNRPLIKQEADIDPITKKFILSMIDAIPVEKRNVFYFIYPSFCGACTDSVMNFIKEERLGSFHSHYIVPSSDSLKYNYKEYINGRIRYMDPYLLGQHGLASGSNKMFVFDDTTCIYYAQLSSEDVTRARREVAALDSAYRH
jgi:hypothetical protein